MLEKIKKNIGLYSYYTIIISIGLMLIIPFFDNYDTYFESNIGGFVYYFGNHDFNPYDYGNGLKSLLSYNVVFYLSSIIGFLIMLIRISTYQKYEYDWRSGLASNNNFIKKKWLFRNSYFFFEYVFVLISTFYIINYFHVLELFALGLITYFIFMILYSLYIEDSFDEYLYNQLIIKNKTDYLTSNYEKLIK